MEAVQSRSMARGSTGRQLKEKMEMNPTAIEVTLADMGVRQDQLENCLLLIQSSVDALTVNFNEQINLIKCHLGITHESSTSSLQVEPNERGILGLVPVTESDLKAVKVTTNSSVSNYKFPKVNFLKFDGSNVK